MLGLTVKTAIQPFAWLWFARMITGKDISFKWSCTDSIMESCIVRTDIVPTHGIELLQRSNRFYIQSIELAFFRSNHGHDRKLWFRRWDMSPVRDESVPSAEPKINLEDVFV